LFFIHLFKAFKNVESLEVTLRVSRSNNLTHLAGSFKLTNEEKFLSVLRAIQSENGQPRTTIIVDLDSTLSYSRFLYDLKSLGMINSRFTFILATLVSDKPSDGQLLRIWFNKLKYLENFSNYLKDADKLDLSSFRYGGANFFVFSLVDYDHDATKQLLAQLTGRTNEIPVNLTKTISEKLEFIEKNI
jgi:hypothetical protein